MTIEEVTELRKQEKNKTLREPKRKMFFLPKLEEKRKEISSLICGLLIKRGFTQNLTLGSLLRRLVIKKNSVVKSFKGMGTKKKPYILKSELGNGEFFNAQDCFIDNMYPEGIKQGYCFSNCYIMAYVLGAKKIPAKILSGIFYDNFDSLLHSVLEVENKYIVDFNINLCIDKDLYYNIFPFEVLSEIDAGRIFNDEENLEQNLELFKYKGIMYLNFAYDDVLNYIKNKERQQQNIEFVD